MKIYDATGGSHGAKVDIENRICVHAVTEDAMQDVSKEHGTAFIVYSKRNFVAGSQTNENILYFKYTGTSKVCYIDRIIFSSNSTDAKVEVYKGPTGVSGGTLVTPINLNFNRNEAANAIAYNGDTTLTMTVAAELELYDVRLAKSTFIVETTGLVLGNGDAIGILGSVATAGDKIRCSMFFYEDTVK